MLGLKVCITTPGQKISLVTLPLMYPSLLETFSDVYTLNRLKLWFLIVCVCLNTYMEARNQSLVSFMKH